MLLNGCSVRALLAPCIVYEAHGRAQARLTPGFRTRLCSSINGEEPCRLGSQCQNAHSPAELRVKAAIELGYLPHDYKTAFCEAFLHSGKHSWHANVTFSNCQRKKLLLVSAWDALLILPSKRLALMAGNCEDGMECMNAHNLCELRVLAAIDMGLMDMAFKTNLCKAYEASQDCQQGNNFSHSYHVCNTAAIPRLLA